MIADYFIWQYRVGPIWLATFSWNVQRVLWHSFSVPVMATTLFAHWHRDAVSYHLAGIGSLVLAFTWNQISRAIGFLIRITVLLLWAVVASVVAVISVATLVIFFLWPLIILGFFGAGSFLLLQG